MRSAIRGVTLLVLYLAAAPAYGHAQTALELGKPDRVRLAEARRLAELVCDRIWPGWGQTAFPVLLVGDSAEFFIGRPRTTVDFAPLGHDPGLGSEIWTRSRRLSPNLLATFPAVDGIPTVVVGSAERTGKSSAGWVLTLLHEHFHQWQYSQRDYYAGVSRLDLASGDTTGRWMLDYPFPYDSAPVRRAMRSLATALLRALEPPPRSAVNARRDVIDARDTLSRHLSAADYRYLEFQLWQEGVARYIEYAAARAAAETGPPRADFRRLPDYEPYERAAESLQESLRRELRELDLARQRRVAFYPVGAAVALLLDKRGVDWKRAYARQPFALAALLSVDP